MTGPSDLEALERSHHSPDIAWGEPAGVDGDGGKVLLLGSDG